MKQKKRRTNKLLCWLIFAALFLLVVHVLFNIHPKNKWFSAVWSAGDFITFVGTVALGYVSYSQTEKSEKMARDANKISDRLTKIQLREYEPLLAFDKFLVSDKYAIETESNALKSGKIHTLALKIEGVEKPQLGYSVVLYDGNVNTKAYSRIYFFFFEYKGKFPINDLSLLKIVFYWNGGKNSYDIDSSDFHISVVDGNKVVLCVNFESNESFMKNGEMKSKIVLSTRVKFMFLMKTRAGNIKQTIRIEKLYLKYDNTEQPISWHYSNNHV